MVCAGGFSLIVEMSTDAHVVKSQSESTMRWYNKPDQGSPLKEEKEEVLL